MAFWRSKSKVGGYPRNPRIEVAPRDYFGDVGLTRLVYGLQNRQNLLNDVAALPPAERDYVLGILCDDKSPIPTFEIRGWFDAQPSGVGAAAVGMAMVRDAWVVRGHGHAEEVSQPSFSEFHARLREADDFLQSAANTWPTEPALGTPLLTSTRGLQLGSATLNARMSALHELEPWGYRAGHEYLQFLCAKWFGSHEKMFAAARAFKDSPPGSAVRAMLPTAHMEYTWKETDGFVPKDLSPDDAAELAAELRGMVAAVGDKPGPDQVDALFRFVWSVRPQDAETATAVLRAVELIDGRCSHLPAFMFASRLEPFDEMMNVFVKEAQEAGGKLG